MKRFFALVLVMAFYSCDDNSALKYYMWGSGDLNIECLQSNLASGVYEQDLSVSLSCNELNTATLVVYTIDGTEPVVGSDAGIDNAESKRGVANEVVTKNIAAQITGSTLVFDEKDPVIIELGETVTIKAMAVLQNPWKKDVYHKSSIQEFTYTTVKREWKEVGQLTGSIKNINFHVAKSGNIYLGYRTNTTPYQPTVKKFNGNTNTWTSFTNTDISGGTNTAKFAMCIDENENVKTIYGDKTISIYDLVGGNYSSNGSYNISNQIKNTSDFNMYCKGDKTIFSYYLKEEEKYKVYLFDGGSTSNVEKYEVFYIAYQDLGLINSLSNNLAMHTDDDFNTYVLYMDNVNTENGFMIDKISDNQSLNRTSVTGAEEINEDQNAVMPNIFTHNGKTYIAYVDNGDIITGLFDGYNYTQLLSPVLPREMKAGGISMHGDENGSPFIAVKYAANPENATEFRIAVYKFENNKWNDVGSFPAVLSKNADSYDKFKIFVRTLNGKPVPFVAFTDTGYTFRIYKYE